MIKLVIWDLDETFWAGTLAEESVSWPDGRAELIGALTGRGIMCSVASKNELERARAELTRRGLWDSFVFPEISYSSKSEMVRRILDRAQLRPANTLFIDDNFSNREEVRYYFPEIRIEGPEFIAGMLSDPALAGKPDPARDRLRQYKDLEVRAVDSDKYGSAEEFLRQAQIGVSVTAGTALLPDADRVLDLVGRANQLNFTKRRLDADRLKHLLTDPGFFSGAVSAEDRYGDYGIIGFFAVDLAKSSLEQFVFSCRILNLGIEQWTWAHVGYPSIEVVQPVVSELREGNAPDWIELKAANPRREPTRQTRLQGGNRWLLRGGCDMEQIAHYLRAYSVDATVELTLVSDLNNAIHRDDTTLALSRVRHSPGQLANAIRDIPFADPRMFETSLLSDEHDLIVCSVLMDYTRTLYRHKATGVLIPFGAYDNLMEGFAEDVAESLTRSDFRGVTPETIRRFRSQFEAVGPITTGQFRENLAEIRRRVKAPIVFLNGAEIDISDSHEPAAVARHRVMNRELDEFAARADGCAVADVRPLVTGPQMLTNGIRHYRRAVYPELAKSVMNAAFPLLGSTPARRLIPGTWLHTGKEILKETFPRLRHAVRALRRHAGGSGPSAGRLKA